MKQSLFPYPNKLADHFVGYPHPDLSMGYKWNLPGILAMDQIPQQLNTEVKLLFLQEISTPIEVVFLYLMNHWLK